MRGDIITGIDVIQHDLVPKHEILSKEEKEKLLEELGVTEKGLPKIFSSDPTIVNLNPKKGDVVKIMRKSQTAGESVYYRVVKE
ncbi:MAG: DNA-directed RNA polymerase subunit H [Candidatus Thorarchaeota archaeon]